MVRHDLDVIDSVIGQTYADWELCLADASDSSHGNVGAIVNEYAKKDANFPLFGLCLKFHSGGGI